VTKNDNLSQNPQQRLALICNDINQWPKSWAGDDSDIIIGNVVLSQFKLYLLHLIAKGRATTTIKKHANCLWALGGEIIRDTNEYGWDERLPSKNIVLKYVNDSGGPYWRHADGESDLRLYDNTCRQLYKFLIDNAQE